MILSIADHVNREIAEFERHEAKAKEALEDIRANLALLRGLKDEVERHGIPCKTYKPGSEPVTQGES